MNATQMNSAVAGQQTERILLARLLQLANGEVAPSGGASGAGFSISGNIGGFTSAVKFTQVTSNNTYAGGQSVGGLITFANALRTPGTGIIDSVTLWDLDHQNVALDLLLFDSAPTTTPADHTSWAAVSGDATKLLGRIAIASADWVTYNNIGFVTEKGLGIAAKASGTSLFGVLLCNGSAPVYTGLNRVGGILGTLQD